MRMNTVWLVGALAIGGVVAAGAAEAPKENKGFAASKTTIVDLGPDFPAMAGRQLRLRLVTIQPGGHIGLHDHKERPAVVYFIQGTDTVINDDGSAKTFKAGDTAAESGAAIHWHRNDGPDAVIFVAADIFKPAQ
jgi:quercetin dioxygenase-like cupin family protein